MNPVLSKPVLPDITSGPTGTFHILKQGLLDASISFGLPGLEVARGVKIVISPPNPAVTAQEYSSKVMAADSDVIALVVVPPKAMPSGGGARSVPGRG